MKDVGKIVALFDKSMAGIEEQKGDLLQKTDTGNIFAFEQVAGQVIHLKKGITGMLNHQDLTSEKYFPE